MHGDARGHLLVAVVILTTTLAGCTTDGTEPTRPTELVVSIDNQGEDPMPTALTIEGPNGTLLEEEIQASPGNTTRTVEMTSDGTYRAEAHYEANRPGQHVEGDRAHIVTRDDCQTTTIVIHLVIEYTRTATSQTWRNYGSYGECTG